MWRLRLAVLWTSAKQSKVVRRTAWGAVAGLLVAAVALSVSQCSSPASHVTPTPTVQPTPSHTNPSVPKPSPTHATHHKTHHRLTHKRNHHVRKFVVVKRGDCLWTLAHHYLHNGLAWHTIFKLNHDKISNPNLIYAGQVLQL